MALWLFALAAGCLAYTYAGYPLALAVLARVRRTPGHPGSTRTRLPSVTVVIAAHNEEAIIARRIRNLLAQTYPEACLEVIVGSDGSTDATVVAARAVADGRVRVLDLQRGGRALVHNVCAAEARGEVLVFTDAGTTFAPDCLERLIAPLAHEAAVGCTTGQLIYTNSGEPGIAQSAGWYWKFELLLRRLETACGSTVAVTGACMAVRRILYRPLDPADDIDDAAPVEVLLARHRVVYVSEAHAYDQAPSSSGTELAARRRIVTKNLTAIVRRPRILLPQCYPAAAWQLLSHRILRYLTPVFLLLCALATMALLDRPRFQFAAAVQGVFYGGALLGWLADRRHWQVPIAPALFAFCLANYGFLLGVVNIMRRRGVTSYEPIR